MKGSDFMNPFLSLLQCGGLLFIPLLTFFGGLWLVIRFLGPNHRLSLFLFAFFVGFSFFEFSVIGILMDAPKGGLSEIGGLVGVIRISGIIGFIASVAVLIIAPIYRYLFKMMR